MTNLENRLWASLDQEIKKRKTITHWALLTNCSPQISNKILKFDTDRKYDHFVYSQKFKICHYVGGDTKRQLTKYIASLTKSENGDCLIAINICNNEAFPSLSNVITGEMLCSFRKDGFV